MALKCYDGDNHHSTREPRLRDCGRNQDLCVSFRAKTDSKDKGGTSIPAGTWLGQCTGRSSPQADEFEGDFSERCIVSKKILTVSFNIWNTSR